MNSIEIKAYKCEKCGNAYLHNELADNCCKPKHCEDCGAELPHKWYMTVCESCKTKRDFNRGKVLTMGEFLLSEYKDNMVCYNDEYYMAIDECLESLYDTLEDEELEEINYVKATNKITHELNVDNLIEELECETNCEEDISVDKQGVKELEDFLKLWNEKYHLTTYNEANVYIKIDDDIKKEYFR